MASVFLKDLEADAAKVLNFFNKAQSKTVSAGPGVVAGLGTVLGAVSKAVADGSAAAGSGGVNIALDAETLADVKQVWPDIQAFVADLGIKL